MKVVYVLMMLICLFACRQRTKVTGERDKNDTTGKIPVTEQTCYAYIKGRDTAMLTLVTTGIAVTGELQYNWFEKDKSFGHLAGEMRGDTLIADYTFTSEGRESVRQVAFLKKGNQYLEGFADLTEKGRKTQFKDLRNLNFGNAIAFEKTVCR